MNSFFPAAAFRFSHSEEAGRCATDGARRRHEPSHRGHVNQFATSDVCRAVFTPDSLRCPRRRKVSRHRHHAAVRVGTSTDQPSETGGWAVGERCATDHTNLTLWLSVGFGSDDSRHRRLSSSTPAASNQLQRSSAEADVRRIISGASWTDKHPTSTPTMLPFQHDGTCFSVFLTPAPPNANFGQLGYLLAPFSQWCRKPPPDAMAAAPSVTSQKMADNKV